jgi:hypothetical protein
MQQRVEAGLYVKRHQRRKFEEVHGIEQIRHEIKAYIFLFAPSNA